MGVPDPDCDSNQEWTTATMMMRLRKGGRWGNGRGHIDKSRLLPVWRSSLATPSITPSSSKSSVSFTHDFLHVSFTHVIYTCFCFTRVIYICHLQMSVTHVICVRILQFLNKYCLRQLISPLERYDNILNVLFIKDITSSQHKVLLIVCDVHLT